MPASIKPIKRVWKPKVSKTSEALPAPPKFDIYGHEIHEPEVQEKNTDSIWDTYEALRAAQALKLAEP
jgi:hypothetical protein